MIRQNQPTASRCPRGFPAKDARRLAAASAFHSHAGRVYVPVTVCGTLPVSG